MEDGCLSIFMGVVSESPWVPKHFDLGMFLICFSISKMGVTIKQKSRVIANNDNIDICTRQFQQALT